MNPARMIVHGLSVLCVSFLIVVFALFSHFQFGESASSDMIGSLALLFIIGSACYVFVGCLLWLPKALTNKRK